MTFPGILGTEVTVEVKVWVTSRLLGPMRTSDPITMFTNKVANVCKQNTWPQLLGPIQCVLGLIFRTYFCLTKGRHLAPIIGADSMHIGTDFPNLFLSNKRETQWRTPWNPSHFFPKMFQGWGVSCRGGGVM